MEKNKKNALKNHFDQAEKMPPPSLWAGIEGQLSSRNAGNPPKVTNGWALAGGLGLMLLLAAYLYWQLGKPTAIKSLAITSMGPSESGVTHPASGETDNPALADKKESPAQGTYHSKDARHSAVNQAKDRPAANPASGSNLPQTGLSAGESFLSETQDMGGPTPTTTADHSAKENPANPEPTEAGTYTRDQEVENSEPVATPTETKENPTTPTTTTDQSAKENPANLEPAEAVTDPKAQEIGNRDPVATPAEDKDLATPTEETHNSPTSLIPNDCPDFSRSRRPLFYWELGLGSGAAQKYLESLVFPDGGYPQLRRETEQIKPQFTAHFQVGMVHRQFTWDLGLSFLQHRELFRGAKENEIRVTISNVFDTNGQLLRTDTLVESGTRAIQSNQLWRHYQIPLRLGYLKRNQQWSYGAQVGLQWNFLTQRRGILFDPNLAFYSLQEDPQGYFKSTSHFRAQLHLYVAKRVYQKAEIFLNPHISQDLQALTTENSPFEQRYRHLQISAGFRKYF
jgi:hypothetical protein